MNGIKINVIEEHKNNNIEDRRTYITMIVNKLIMNELEKTID